ncbi:class I SAM-dependent methyltransferase [Flavihumibacter fluvii]|uniref:class I SAM-dependent methyltransferase n=1 Tax=Flavihumibacter fluvii TaxID=2838157 RepID=UPI001BDE6150|nr:class I SAM-dependent methyltransferase [Flavihumibacter fluvii]ULQ52080.1 class I SAM-dependent methyltransferase [Flavihumibacter fluvii]
MKDFWNERYSGKDYIYGEEPNQFFADQINPLKAATIILPCEGEGRNAVYAATRGWTVHAFDASTAGQAKALQLAGKRGVSIHYTVEDAGKITYPENSADVVAFIFAHFPESNRKQIHL